MADKGFTIAKLLAEQNVGLVIQHFLSALGQFDSTEVVFPIAQVICVAALLCPSTDQHFAQQKNLLYSPEAM